MAATTADAVRRKHGGHDPMTLAHRIAAALNAPDMTTQILTASTFFWMTALTADGEIVVANNYGLGFIPDRVNLPESVHMATADQTIPAAERARWATYPVAALLGWAAHHGTALRAVFATADQFSGIDPGAPKKVIEPADIPASGKMQGRSRLQVVAPALASQLATVSDLSLVDMVPPAPVDDAPPEDQSAKLWFEAFKPLTWSSSDREQLHLTRFVEYVAHARDLALYQAHHAIHAEAQRAAVADWLYWNHLAGLVIDALTESAPVP
ncbi:secretion protein EccK [Mycobacterium sp. MFM001]|uniref:secretion protein EccK n=1 Tax=Mycobacterium sp. MFM001 TaxID=2049453 RepID=UPI000E2E6D2E|nr:secretion protein EccK [Mycobacterium sp. MFM001]